MIPRAERESGTRDRGREHSAMEGVLAQRGPRPLTRQRRRGVRRSDAMGTLPFPEGRGRVRGGSRAGTSEAASQARTAVDNTVAGRQSAEEPSIGALPGPRYAPHVGARGTVPGELMAPLRGLAWWLRRRLKLELCRQARAPSGWLTGNAGREVSPGSRAARLRPRVSMRSSHRHPPQGGERREARPETQQSAGCS